MRAVKRWVIKFDAVSDLWQCSGAGCSEGLWFQGSSGTLFKDGRGPTALEPRIQQVHPPLIHRSGDCSSRIGC
jgi:hypothetical protein